MTNTKENIVNKSQRKWLYSPIGNATVENSSFFPIDAQTASCGGQKFVSSTNENSRFDNEII
jgi:hypothetical protein